MTALPTPVWEYDNLIDFAWLSERVEWTQSAFVRISGGTTNKALERAHERMGNVQYLRVGQWVSKVISLLEKAAMPNLRALNFCDRLNVQAAVALANALRRTPQVEQFRLCLEPIMSEKATVSLFDALSTLPLTALCFNFWDMLSQHSVERLCTLLQQKRDTLAYLELWSFSRNPDCFNGLTSKGLYGLQHLRILRLYCGAFDEIQMQHLCKAMECMPHLATLRLRVCDVAALTKFFSASFRPITAFEIFAAPDVVDSRLTEMFSALRRNTRLRSLEINTAIPRFVQQSGLAEEGFLTSVFDITSSYGFMHFASALRRNKARHAAAHRACVALIALRRKRGVLKWIAADIVRMIAMWLWDTRNQSAWDSDIKSGIALKKMKIE